MQVLGATAGIGAWIAVVGGARLWARLEAADIPAAQTVSLLPRELLIAEGFRTLVVPLLLAAAIAVLTYLSRVDNPPERERTTPADEESNGGTVDTETESALDRASRALDEARKLAKASADKVADLERRLESTIDADAREGEPGGDVERGRVDELGKARRLARSALAAASAEFAEAAEVARTARKVANEQGWPLDRIHGAIKKLAAASDALDRARDSLRVAEGEHSEADVSGHQQLIAARQAGRIISDVRSEASKAAGVLQRGPQATPLEGLRSLRSQLRELAPVRYLVDWFDGLIRSYGLLPAVLIVLLLVVVFGGIALVIVGDTDWPLVGLFAALCFGVALLLAFQGRPAEALIAVALSLPVLPLVGIASALEPVYALAVIGVTALTIWLSLGAMNKWRSAGAVAWILFAAILFWSGALGFFQELGGDDVELDEVFVVPKSSPVPILGLYLGKTSDHVYIASVEGCEEGASNCRRVLSISDSAVKCLAFGPPKSVTETSVEDKEPRKSQPADSGDDVQKLLTAGSKREDFCSVAATSEEGEIPPAPKSPPEPEPAAPKPVVILDTDVGFRPGSARLTAVARNRLRLLTDRINATDARRIRVHGHTDSRGTREFNRRLSVRRARAVRRVLVDAFGSRAPAIAARGFGELRPRACNTRRDGSDAPRNRARNRRVEIWVDAPLRYERPDCRR